MTRTRALIVLAVLLFASAVFANVRVIQLSSHLSGDEHSTCLVQQRGLRANKYLAVFVGAVHEALVLPESAAQQKALAALPSKIRAREIQLRGVLNSSSGGYSTLEAKQPATRKC